MSKKDFFIILFRMFGIYSLMVTLVKGIPMYLAFISMDIDMELILGMLISLIGFAVPFLFMLYKAPAIVQFLKLDKGFDDDYIHLGALDKVSIIKLGLIIAGGIILADNIITLLPEVFMAFKSELQTNSYEVNTYLSARDLVQLGSDLVGVIAGYIVLTNYSQMAAWIVRAED